jgi:hypothetical protein
MARSGSSVAPRCAPRWISAPRIHTLFFSANIRRITWEAGSIGSVQLPHPMEFEPYLVSAPPSDIAMLNSRVHDSLPEWDITEALQVVNPALASKYAANRHRVAARRNGNPNERMLFHLAPDHVIPKIWQAGEGFESRLAQWAEVGRGAYFCEHLIYNYAYKFELWSPPDKFKVVAGPALGALMRVFAVLVCLGDFADMGPGCESCPSPAFIEWKKEFDYQKKAPDVNPLPTRPPACQVPSDDAERLHAYTEGRTLFDYQQKSPNDNLLPTRPPAIQIPSDDAERVHLLDMKQIKDEPRHDSVTSTEGDLATHRHSNCKTAARGSLCATSCIRA